MKNRDRYPENWFSVIRPRELARAKFRCEDCSIKQGSFGYYNANGVFVECDKFMADWAIRHGFKPRKIHLQVSHNAHDPSKCQPGDLTVRCPKCHMRYDNEIRRLSRIAKKVNAK